LKDDDGFLGDRAARAFRKILDGLRKPLKKNARIRSATNRPKLSQACSMMRCWDGHPRRGLVQRAIEESPVNWPM